LLLPLNGLTVSHVGTPLTTQALQLLVTETVLNPALAATVMAEGATTSVVCPASCVTVMGWVKLHPLTVKVAVRAGPVLAW
jgi:hypothetical protein